MTGETIEVELLATDSLIPYVNNPKEHPDEQVAKIASSIKNYGWDQPIVIDGDREIIKGHGRLQAANKLGLDEIPVIERNDLTDSEVRAARIADNKTAESSWDIDLLGVEFELLDNDGFDLELTAFDEDEIDAFGINREGDEPDAREEWEKADIVDFDNEDELAEFTVKVNFADEEAVEEFNQMVGETVTPDTISIWYPEQEQRQDSSKGWTNES